MHESLSKWNEVLLPQVGLEQLVGVVKRNCCSTPWFTVPHSPHLKDARTSSGLTSLTLVTVPQNEESWPILSVLSPRILNTEGRL